MRHFINERVQRHSFRLSLMTALLNLSLFNYEV